MTLELFSLSSIDLLKIFTNHCKEYWYIGSMVAKSRVTKNNTVLRLAIYCGGGAWSMAQQRRRMVRRTRRRTRRSRIQRRSPQEEEEEWPTK